MKTRYLSIGICLLAIATSSARADDAKEKTSPSASSKVEADIAYTDGNDRQKLDLYLPETKGFATVVFTYGGGWHAGNRKNLAIVGKKLSGLGFGCAVLDHRLGPKDKFPAQIEDVAAAFAWVKGHIAEKGGDTKKVFVMGHSSGAHLSLLLATDAKYLAKHKLAPTDIAGVIGLSPIVDLAPRDDGKGFGNTLMTNPNGEIFSRDPAIMKDASPIHHIDKALPRSVLIVGDKDFPMLAGDAKAFAEKAQGVQSKTTVFIAKDCNHMGTIQAVLNEKSPVMEQILSFLKNPDQP